uniref:Uncharacterized protein n=1 Tax=Glossina austeni TaxID=7395 RepID=A0A1A9UUC0_GLOAU
MKLSVKNKLNAKEKGKNLQNIVTQNYSFVKFNGNESRYSQHLGSGKRVVVVLCNNNGTGSHDKSSGNFQPEKLHTLVLEKLLRMHFIKGEASLDRLQSQTWNRMQQLGLRRAKSLSSVASAILTKGNGNEA